MDRSFTQQVSKIRGARFRRLARDDESLAVALEGLHIVAMPSLF
jgi:hypothetical protein